MLLLFTILIVSLVFIEHQPRVEKIFFYLPMEIQLTFSTSTWFAWFNSQFTWVFHLFSNGKLKFVEKTVTIATNGGKLTLDNMQSIQTRYLINSRAAWNIKLWDCGRWDENSMKFPEWLFYILPTHNDDSLQSFHVIISISWMIN